MLFYLSSLQEYSFIRAPVILHTISSFDQSTLEKSASGFLKGLNLCIKDAGPLRNEITNTPDFWSTIRNVHSMPEAAARVFELLENVVAGKSPAVTADNYESAVSLLNSFASAGSVGAVIEQKRERNGTRPKPAKPSKARDNPAVSHGIRAVSLIYRLTNRVPAFVEQSHLERHEAWTTYWSPIFHALRTQCLNPCREIRHQAFSCLQGSLLSTDLASPDHQEWTAIFGEVLFPLISRLLKPEVYQSDPVGMSETRVQAATLLCRIFLHYLVLLSEWDGMLDLWLKILDILDRLMNSGQADSLVSKSGKYGKLFY